MQGKIVTLTLSRGVKHAEQSLKFNYASAVAAANKLQGEDGEVATITSFNITNQVKLPELISAAVTKEEPDKLLLIFTKDLGEKGNQENTSLGYTVKDSKAQQIEVESVTVSGRTVTLKLKKKLAETEKDVKVSYDKNAANDNALTADSGAVENFNDKDVKNQESTGGGFIRSSVRPDSSTPSKNEEVKKEEPKKEEPKKEEAKKDEMANAPKSAEKVSTKLVIGQKTYTAMVNGQAVEKTMDVAPMVHMGRTVLPARMISELLGVDVKFDQASKTASFMYGEGNKVELTLGQKFMMVNGEKVALTVDILNKDGRILLPVTDIQKAFAKLGLEATVSWDAATKSVTIEK